MEVFDVFDFIQGYCLKNIKTKLFILYVLNAADIIFTFILLKSGLFIEANFLMVNVVQSITFSILLKVILPGALLFVLYYRMRQASEGQLKKSNRLINGALAFYFLINIFHMLWLSILPVIIS